MQLDLDITTNPTWVVHCKRAPYDVYIGRPGEWGNPYIVGVHGDRGECCELFERAALADPAFLERVKRELKGKVLGCWCKPRRCHGDFLARLANE